MSRPRINLLRLEEELSEVHLRLAGVTIEHLPWQQFIKTYDKPGTFFFLDPPYYKAPYYAHNFELSHFRELAHALVGLRSNFILGINDHVDMREAFKSFTMVPVEISYSTEKCASTRGSELQIFS